jgi:predicted permease
MKPCVWLIRVIAIIVPKRFRAEWMLEWESEIKARESILNEWRRLTLPARFDLFVRSLGSFRDALLLQPKRLEEEMFQDLKYGFRMLRNHPGFSAAAILALALGVGANTAIFSVIYGVLLRPLPYKDAERIVVGNISPPDFEDLQRSNQSFDRTAIWGSNLYNASFGDETIQVRGAIVTPEFFPMLEEPMLGRAWGPEEDTHPVVMISHDFWSNRFDSDPKVVGKTIRLSGKVYTIVGVMPPKFEYPDSNFKLWTTFGEAMAQAPEQIRNRQFRIFRVLGHLKPGVTMAQLGAEMNTLSSRLQQEYPATNAGVNISFTPLYERMFGDVRTSLWILLGTVGFVLLIACANVANMMLARTAEREREIAIRSALGAGRGRIVRQLLTESLFLTSLAAGVGLLLAKWGIKILPTLNPDDIPRLSSIEINAPVLLFTLGLSVVTGLLFGLAPALTVSGANMTQPLKEGGRGAQGGARGRRLRNSLVVIEVALSVVVLAGAGLLVKSFLRLTQVDVGVDARDLLTANVGLVQFKDPARRVEAQREMINRIASLPGVAGVAAGTGRPPTIAQRGTRFALEGTTNDDPGARSAYFIAVSPDYFHVLGARIIEGREFTSRDNAESPKVVVLSRGLANRLFPNESPIGKRLQLINPEQSNEPREIVGVAGDIRYSGLNDPDVRTIYTPFAQTPFLWNYLMIRADRSPEALSRSIAQATRSVDPSLEAADFRPMEKLISESSAQPRFYMLLLGAFALLAFVLAIVGVYSVIAYSVARRSHEIGVRMALGASSARVVRMIIGQGMLPALLGIGIGVAAAFGLTRWISTMLYEVSATDPLIFAGVTAMLAVAAFAACYLPARKAAKIDPMNALRAE